MSLLHVASRRGLTDEGGRGTYAVQLVLRGGVKQRAKGGQFSSLQPCTTLICTHVRSRSLRQICSGCSLRLCKMNEVGEDMAGSVMGVQEMSRRQTETGPQGAVRS